MVDVRIYTTDKGSCFKEDGEILEEGEIYLSEMGTPFNRVVDKLETKQFLKVESLRF